MSPAGGSGPRCRRRGAACGPRQFWLLRAGHLVKAEVRLEGMAAGEDGEVTESLEVLLHPIRHSPISGPWVSWHSCLGSPSRRGPRPHVFSKELVRVTISHTAPGPVTGAQWCHD